MKQVQVAEFRTGFRDLTEPAEVMKYKEVVGTWYPGSLGPAAEVREAQSIIDAKNDEIKMLKRRVAELMNPSVKMTMRSEAASVDDAIRTLPAQDREFFERKLGKKK